MDKPFESGLVVESYEGGGHDRATILDLSTALVIILADGAGGASGGAEAATLVIGYVRRIVSAAFPVGDTGAWCGLLVDMDRALETDSLAGETTAVVLALTRSHVTGASVGDSRAILFARDATHDLTRGQHRRPLLGSGGAIPVPFSSKSLIGTIVVASDGLFKYTPLETIAKECREAAAVDLPRRLVDLVRLPAGGLRDDTAVVVADTR